MREYITLGLKPTVLEPTIPPIAGPKLEVILPVLMQFETL